MQNFEGLGTFYLGARFDLGTKRKSDELVLYDSKDLATHAVCVGMTGSGKTGLCSVLLEEAAIDGIPALVIDPKGDLANLMLSFPDLSASDFAPWIDPAEARQKGQTVEQLAAATAATFAEGLADWGQDGTRIRRMRETTEFAIYTPGSNAARSISILSSFAAPSAEALEDAEAFTERVATTVSSLLSLAGIAADPVKSREHILLSNIVQRAWTDRRDLDLGALIQEVQKPSVQRIGVFELEAFYPAKERFELALTLNNLLASPGFAAWMEGEPLELDHLLYTKEGKPRIAILSIAHLSDAQRMFFVSLLFNQVLAWVRKQNGTTSLRALIYMDEIVGYFPPVANPPSKQPMLTLMKQARAFGVGVVLATQNPVDIDYKGLANAGTWFIGRLQTERDKARLLDGLEGAMSTAGANFDRAAIERTLSQLSNRAFLMNNVHENAPVVFQTRWALSYLRGPLTRAELKRLSDSIGRPTPLEAPSMSVGAMTKAIAARPATSTPSTPNSASDRRPVLPADIAQYFLPVRGPLDARIEYRPMLFASAKVFFADAKAKIESEESLAWLSPCVDGPVAVDWDRYEEVALGESELERDPQGGASFAPLPTECTKAKSYEAWKRAFADSLFRNRKLELLSNSASKLVSRPAESERDFSLRVAQVAREARDADVAALRAKYAPRIAALEERKRKREQTVEVQAAQARQAKVSTAISFGSALLTAFLGRKAVSAGSLGRAATAARGVGRSLKESTDVDRAEQDVSAVGEELALLNQAFQRDLAALGANADAQAASFERITLRPKKTGVTVRALVLVWAPHRVAANGAASPAWR